MRNTFYFRFWKLCCLIAFMPVGTKVFSDEARDQVKLAETKTGGEFHFETSQISGTIQTQGHYHGIGDLVEKSSGHSFVDERYSLLNLFKLMSANQMMDQPRMMERTYTSGPDWVEIKWPASEGYQGTVTARYEIKPPNAIELLVTAETKGSYRGFEVFLSSYFDGAAHQPYIFLKTRNPKKPPELVSPVFNEVFKNTLLVFPRDAHAARLCLDGRWDRNERKAPTVQLSPVRHYAYPLAIVADNEKKTAVALMTKPEHSYAISARYLGNAEGKRQTTYTAFDYALFGNDMNRGDKRSVRIRLEVFPLKNQDPSLALKNYRSFSKKRSQETPKSPAR